MKFSCVRADRSEASRLAAFLQDVWSKMEHKEWFAIENEDYIADVLQEGHGFGWKVMEQESGKVAAVCVIAIPGLSEENLGYDIGLECDDLRKVAHMDISAVAPEFRGNRLQHLMASVAEQELAARGYTLLMCTIHPDNRFSYETMERMGYRFVKQARKYGGLLRNIYLKRLPDGGVSTRQ